MSLQIRIVVSIDHACLGELTHVLRSIDEEHVHVLQNEVERDRILLAKDLGRRCVVELEPNAQGALVVGRGGRCVGGEARPERIAAARKDPYAELLRQIWTNLKDAFRDAVRLPKDGPLRWALAGVDTALLDHPNEHLDEPRVWVCTCYARL